jgi:hypothetical protein
MLPSKEEEGERKKRGAGRGEEPEIKPRKA